MTASSVRVLLASLIVLAWSPGAMARSLDWNFQNSSGRTIHVELYSKTRTHVWPGGGILWILPANGLRYTNRISCNRGEYICYGAWTADESGPYWGAGKGGNAGCADCCYYCRGGSTRLINLIP